MSLKLLFISYQTLVRCSCCCFFQTINASSYRAVFICGIKARQPLVSAEEGHKSTVFRGKDDKYENDERM